MKEFKTLPATKELLEEFYGDQMPDATMMAVVGIIDEKVVAVGGILITGNRPVAFIDTSDEAKLGTHYIRKLIKSSNNIMQFAKNNYSVIYATPKDNAPEAISFMKHYGFEPYIENYQNMDIYRWCRQWN